MRRTSRIAFAAVVITAVAAAGGATAYGAWDSGPGAPARQTDQQVERPVVVRPAADRPRVDRPVADRPPTQSPDAPTPAPVGGPVELSPGDTGAQVRELQARLRQIGWFFGDVTDFYGDRTREAVAGFQAKRGFPSTGVVDRRTRLRLEEMTTEPTADELANARPDPADGAALDQRCLTGRVLCVDKTSSSLRWVVEGDVRLTLDARFGGNGYVTREGEFSVSRMSRDHVSSLYDTSMPFAMFFSGGQAVHYSPDFAANGYNGASHGCVNIRDYEEIAWLFDQVRLGDKVVVYWS